jgi:phosphopantetheinyl transferase
VQQSGTTLRARCTFDLDRHPFLRDHTIGRDVSASDPSLCGFPIVPFTALMEAMAEAAVLLLPGQLVIGMREVRVHRWLAVDRGPVQLDLLAEPASGTEVAVRVTEASSSGLGPVAEGVMVLGTRYPHPPQAPGLPLANQQPYKWRPVQLYAEAMFHGPLFRGVQAITGLGDDGAEATLTVIPRRTLLGEADVNGLATDMVLLDQPGQVVGFWANQRLERGFVVLPSRMAALHLYGPILPHGDRLTCRARIALVGDRQVRSDLDVVDARGRLWARFEGWEDHRFDVPGDVYRALLQPATACLATLWPAVGDGSRGLTSYRIGLDRFPPGWLHAHGGMWSRVLAALVLGRRERVLWHAMQAPERRRLEWLLGRIAAKDAVRDFVSRRFNLSLRPAEIEILPDASGRPIVAGAWTEQVGSVPLVSISHVDGAAVAVLTDSNGTSGVGIDLERRGRMKPGMEDVMFNAGERALLDGFDGEDRDMWALRLWCAKEASAKATGCAVGPASAHLAVEQVHREDGTVVLRCRTPMAGSVTLTVSTAREGDWIVATCIDKSSRTMTEVRTS